MELWAACAVVVNVHFILIKLVKVLFQYLIPNKSYNKPCDLKKSTIAINTLKAHGAIIFCIEISVTKFRDFSANLYTYAL